MRESIVPKRCHLEGFRKTYCSEKTSDPDKDFCPRIFFHERYRMKQFLRGTLILGTQAPLLFGLTILPVENSTLALEHSVS